MDIKESVKKELKADEDFQELLKRYNMVHNNYTKKVPEIDFVKLIFVRIDELLERYAKAKEKKNPNDILIIKVGLLENIFLLEVAQDIEADEKR